MPAACAACTYIAGALKVLKPNAQRLSHYMRPFQLLDERFFM